MKKNNWFLRIFSLVLTFVLAFTVVANPVSAAGNGFFINAFDYGLPTLNSTTLEEGEYFTLSDSTKLNNVTFDIPRSYISYVELVFYADIMPSQVILVNAVNGLSGYNLTMEDLGGGMYRGTVVPGSALSALTFRFVMQSYPAHVQIMSCRYSTEYSPESTIGKISVYQAGSNVGSVTMSSPSTPAVVTFGGSKTDIEQATWYTDCTVEDWKNYTHINYIFSCLVLSVTSIYAFVGDQSVPCEISYIDMPSEGTAGTDPDQVDNYRKRIQFSVMVDLSDIPANTEDTLILYVSGTSSLNTTGNEVRLTSVLGYHDYEQSSGVIYFLQKIWKSITSLAKNIEQYFIDLGDRIEAIFNGDEDQKQEMEDINTEMGDTLDDMSQNATLPSISVEDYDVGQIMDDYGADTSYFGSFFAAVLNVPTIYYIFFMMLVFAFVSYIIYGSK